MLYMWKAMQRHKRFDGKYQVMVVIWKLTHGN